MGWSWHHDRYGARDTPWTNRPEEATLRERTPAELVAAAATGDQGAWGEIVERYSGLVWSVARAHALSPADSADVAQTTWLRLVEHLDRLRDPERVGGWLAATARHECLRVLRRAVREWPAELACHDCVEDGRRAVEPSPEAAVLASERRALLLEAYAELSERCRRLLRVLSSAPPLSYADAAAALGVPVGSVGPTRARCLDQLRWRLAKRDAFTQPTDS